MRKEGPLEGVLSWRKKEGWAVDVVDGVRSDGGFGEKQFCFGCNRVPDIQYYDSSPPLSG